MQESHWTRTIIQVSETIDQIIHYQGYYSSVPSQGRVFQVPPVAIHTTPASQVFYYLQLSSAIASIWQTVLHTGCLTWRFEIMLGAGKGVMEGVHLGTVLIDYTGQPIGSATDA